jgi:hypothetical protein
MDKASDLAVLVGLNKVIDARTIDSRIEESSEGKENGQIAQEIYEADTEDREGIKRR